MFDLRTALVKLKDDTMALISCLEAEDYDLLQGLLNDRQAIIDEMDECGFNKQHFKELCEEFKIIELNTKMQAIMNQKINIIKCEMKKIQLNKNVNNNYTTNMAVDSIYFNKKI